MKRLILSTISVILLSTTCYAVDVTVHATGFRNDRGLARIALFSSPDGFPDRPKNNKTALSVKIRNGQATAMVPNIPAGTYAVTVLHDEDMDAKIKLGFLGIPQEGYGISNQTKGIFGPPRFSEALTPLQNEKELVRIRILY